ncbi:MAG: amino acid ABC transporter permease [bacterium]
MSNATAMMRSVRSAPMFRDRTNTIATAMFGAILVYLGARFARWAVVNAVWTVPPGVGSAPCRAVAGSGACWAVISDRLRFISLGTYPLDQQWRPVVASLLFIALYAASARRSWWKPGLFVLWLAVPALAIVLLRGGWFGLSSVATEFWGGLPLTFLLSTVSFALAFPFGVALALGRRSEMPAVRTMSITYIELIRAVPLVSMIFMAAVMFPLFVPQSFTLDKLLRAHVAFVMVMSAYLAEVLRGGLQAIPKGQYEAAASIGLPYWPTTVMIVLPQAVRTTIPSIVNTFIGFFKDTSLVAVIGLFDLLGAAKAVIVDPKWVGFGVEVYLFVAAVYFTFTFSVSRYTQRLERVLSAERNH